MPLGQSPVGLAGIHARLRLGISIPSQNGPEATESLVEMALVCQYRAHPPTRRDDEADVGWATAGRPATGSHPPDRLAPTRSHKGVTR
jgi:hypothetical protein